MIATQSHNTPLPSVKTQEGSIAPKRRITVDSLWKSKKIMASVLHLFHLV